MLPGQIIFKQPISPGYQLIFWHEFYSRSAMKYFVSYLIFVLTLISCQSSEEKSGNAEIAVLQQDLDSIQQELHDLKALLAENKTVSPADSATKNSRKLNSNEATAHNPEPKKEPRTQKKEKITSPTTTSSQSDSLVYYYINGKISVIRTPLKDGRAWWLFYDLQGEETCRLQEVHLSYTESVELKFHPNGAASHAYIHSNPGASMYFYESEITFDTNNVPGWKTTRQYPPSLEDAMKPPYYWDKKTKTWKQQETVIEQNTPK